MAVKAAIAICVPAGLDFSSAGRTDPRQIAFDIETGEWEMDTSEITACERLKARYPDAQNWIVRVGSRYVRRFGAGRAQKKA